MARVLLSSAAMGTGPKGVLWATAFALAVACGGSVNTDGGSTTGGTGGTGAVGAFGGTGGTGGTVFTGGTGGTVFTGGTGGKPDSGTGGTYVDPGCPDAEPPEPYYECDVFGPNTCPPGDACYPYVQYPTGPCELEQYGAVCIPAGTGQQGEPCGAGTCAAGLVCVITGQGTECVQICKLGGPNTCPKGLFCVPIDVEGIGGCY